MRRLAFVLLFPILFTALMQLTDGFGAARVQIQATAGSPTEPGDKPWLADIAAFWAGVEEASRTESAPVNLLILGIDRRPNDSGRTDVMLLVSFFAEPAGIHVLSIPRDTAVQLQERLDKINAAYAYGGAALAQTAVADLLGITIADVVVVDFAAFAGAVDALGGVDLQIAADLDYEDPYQNLAIHIPAGLQHLDGETALQYVRFRADDRGDLGRIERQQAFLRALMEQHLAPETLLRLPALWQAVAPYLETTLTLPDLIRYGDRAKDAYPHITFSLLDGTGEMMDGVYYLKPDPEQLGALRQLLQGKAPLALPAAD